MYISKHDGIHDDVTVSESVLEVPCITPHLTQVAHKDVDHSILFFTNIKNLVCVLEIIGIAIVSVMSIYRVLAGIC